MHLEIGILFPFFNLVSIGLLWKYYIYVAVDEYAKAQ
jgi:hypothetical protein